MGFGLVLAVVWLTGCSLFEARLVSGTLLYEDDFSPRELSQWYVERDGIGQSAISDEMLQLVINEPDTVQYSTLVAPQFEDFVLEVEVTQLAGGLNSSYGVLFRHNNIDGFYRFAITGNGLYLVEKRVNGQWQRLTPEWTESVFIAEGLNSTNTLRVTAVGDALSFEVNGRPLVSFKDGSYGEGQIALSAGTFATGGLVVAFDNVVVRYP